MELLAPYITSSKEDKIKDGLGALKILSDRLVLAHLETVAKVTVEVAGLLETVCKDVGLGEINKKFVDQMRNNAATLKILGDNNAGRTTKLACIYQITKVEAFFYGLFMSKKLVENLVEKKKNMVISRVNKVQNWMRSKLAPDSSITPESPPIEPNISTKISCF